MYLELGIFYLLISNVFTNFLLLLLRHSDKQSSHFIIVPLTWNNGAYVRVHDSFLEMFHPRKDHPVT